MRILPPGPWLPSGEEPADTVDIGIRMRDSLYTHAALAEIRESFGQLLPVVLHHQDFEAASRVCQAWLETWPAGALVDEARESWTVAPTSAARAVLERVTELHGLARGWQVLSSGMALMPDAGWLAGELRESGVVVSRGEDDGSEQVAALLGTTVGEVEFGVDALPDASPAWADRLHPAPPGALGERMQRRCEVASLPGSPERLARGDSSEVGWLLWEGAHPPRAVHPRVLTLLHALDEPRSVEELMRSTGWAETEVRTALESLAGVGAVGAVSG